MPHVEVLTIVAADVPEGRVADLRSAYEALVASGLPEGLVETSLLQGEGDEWAIASRWRDRAALVALRASGEPPAALRLFTEVGARPRVGIFDVVVTRGAGA
jgi:heme-degrading monooxygenase HmoA